MTYLLTRLKGVITVLAAFVCGLFGTLSGTLSLLNTFSIIDIGDNVVSLVSGIISLLLARITVAFIHNARAAFEEAAALHALKLSEEALT